MATLRSLLANPVDNSVPISAFSTTLPVGESLFFQATCWSCCVGDWQEPCCVKFRVPAGQTNVTFEIWGGGGAGAGTCCCMGGPPGGSGAYSKKTITGVANDEYELWLGIATACSPSNIGCRGCTTYITGPGLSNFCAEGGVGGCACCFPSCCFSMCTCGTQAQAYGGDINYEGVRGCFWYICCNNACWNKYFVPYPAGLVNQCGGTAAIGARCNGYQNFEMCQVNGFIGYAGVRSQYTPGMGGITSYVTGGCCSCGQPGRPGLIKITYK